MKKKLFLFAMFFASLVFTQVKAADWTGGPVTDGTDTCYVLNVGQSLFLTQGGSWGTQAKLAGEFMPVEIVKTGELYSLHLVNTQNNATQRYLGTGGYIDADQPTDGWTIAPVEGAANVYTISYGATPIYFGFDGANSVYTEDKAADANYQWKFVPRDEVKNVTDANMGTATKEVPADATYYIPMSKFHRNNAACSAAWTGVGAYGYTAMEHWNKNFDTHRTISIPNGTYKLTMDGFYRYGNKSAAIAANTDGTFVVNSYLYANAVSSPLMSIFDGTHLTDPNNIVDALNTAGEQLGAGYYADNKVYVDVTDGTLTFGVKKETLVANDWTVFDNFQLYYYGTETDAADVAYYEKNKALLVLIEALQADIDAAKRLTPSETATVAAALADAIAAAEAVVAAPTAENLPVAKEDLKKAVFFNEASFATPENPYDVTNKITTSWLNGQSISGHHNFCSNCNVADGEYTGTFTESWSGSAYPGRIFYQIVSELPVGSYTLKAACFGNDQSDGVLDEGYYLYCADGKSAYLDVNGVSKYLQAVGTCFDGNLEIGIALETAVSNWNAFADMTLVYNGYVDPLPAMIESYNLKYDEAASLLSSNTYMVGQITTDLSAAMVEVSTLTTVEEATAAINSLTSALTAYLADYLAFSSLNDMVTAYASYDNLSAARQSVTDLLMAPGTVVSDLSTASGDFYAAVLEYAKAYATRTNPVDITPCIVTNGDLKGDASGWTGTPGAGSNVCEYYQATFNFYQILTAAPVGMYRVTAQAFQRPGWNDSGAAYASGSENISVQIFANENSAPVGSLYSVTTTESWGSLNGYANSMGDADKAFSASDANYMSSVYGYADSIGGLTIGLKNEVTGDGYWCCFRNFRVYYMGTEKINIINPEEDLYSSYAIRSIDGDSTFLSLTGLAAGSKNSYSVELFGDDQYNDRFYLVPTGKAHTYKLKTAGGQYAVASHAWNGAISASVTDASDFVIADQGYGIYALKSPKGYVGVNSNEDPTIPGTFAYTNKGLTNGWCKWEFVPVAEDSASVLAAAVELFESTVAAANAKIDFLESEQIVGSDVLMVDSAAYKALVAGISDPTFTTLDEYLSKKEAITSLIEAAGKLNAPDPSVTYQFVNLTRDDKLLDVSTAGKSGVIVAADNYGTSQRFNILPAENGYYIKSLNGNYVTMDGGNAWSMNANPEAVNATFEIEYAGSGNYALKNLYNNGYVGADGDGVCYGDKAVTFNSWNIIPFTSLPVARNIAATTAAVTMDVAPSLPENSVKVVVLSATLLETLVTNEYTDINILKEVGDESCIFDAIRSVSFTATSDYSGMGLSEAIAPAGTYTVIAGEFDGENNLIESSVIKKTVTSPLAGEFPIVLTTEDGLPGTESGSYKYWRSQTYEFAAPVSVLRFTVTDTDVADTDGGGTYKCFALGEFNIYDAAGNALALTAENFSTNAQEPSEGPIANICDGDPAKFFHSMWQTTPDAYHYIEVALPEPMYTLSFGFTSRATKRCIPTAIGVTAGTEYPVSIPEYVLEAYPNNSYAMATGHIELDKLCAAFGLTEETLSAEMAGFSCYQVSYDETGAATLVPTATYDGWFDGAGNPHSWGDDARICCKWFGFDPEDPSEINVCQMPGQCAAGDSYSCHMAIVYGEKQFIYKVTLNIVAEPAFEPVLFDTISIVAFHDGVYTDYSNVPVDLTEQLTALGIENIGKLKIFAYVADTLNANQTANAGFWYNADGTVCSYAAAGCSFFIENTGTPVLTFGQYPEGITLGNVFKTSVALGMEDGDNDRLIKVNCTYLIGYPAAEGICYVKELDSWLNGGTVNESIDPTLVAGLWSYAMSADGIEIDVQIDPAATSTYWGSTGFYLDPSLVEYVFGIDPATTDITTFYPLDGAGEALTAWSSYTPGQWYTAAGDAAAWDTGAAYWYYQIYPGTYYDFSDADGYKMGYVLCGKNPGIITKDTPFTQKSILNGKQWNVTITFVDGVGIENVGTDASTEVESRTYYSISGARIDAPAKGINIVRSVMRDGSVKTEKMFVK